MRRRLRAAFGAALGPRLRTTLFLMVAGIVTGLVVADPFQGEVARVVVPPSIPELLGRNLGVGFIIAAGGAVGGVVTIVCVLVNGLVVGMVTGSLAQIPGGPEVVFASIVPHGVFEVPAYALFGASGLGVAAHTLKLVGAPVQPPSARALGREVLIASLLLVAAALVECLVTPAILNAQLARGSAIDLGLFRWVAVAVLALVPYVVVRLGARHLFRRNPRHVTQVALAVAVAGPVLAVGVAAMALSLVDDWVQVRAAASNGQVDGNVFQVLALTLAVGLPTLVAVGQVMFRDRHRVNADAPAVAHPLQRAALLSMLLLGTMGTAAGWALRAAGMPDVPARVLALSLSLSMAFVLGPLVLRLVLPRQEHDAGDGIRLAAALRTLERAGISGHRLRIARAGGTRMVNAVATGVVPGRTEIVLTRELVDALEPDEIAAVAAHEAGHLRRHHLRWLLLAAVVLSAATATALAAIVPLFDGLSSAAGAIGLVSTATLLSAVLLPAAMAWVSRRLERDADRYAARLGAGAALARALEKLAVENGGTGTPTRLERLISLHPPTAERVAALARAGEGGGHTTPIARSVF